MAQFILARGSIDHRMGVFPPEGGVNPMDLLQTANQFVKLGEKRGIPVAVERIDSEGKSEKIDIANLAKSLA